MKTHLPIWFVLFILSVAYNFPILKLQLGIYDEGIILTGADRILKGHHPYGDFWAMYSPGQFYTLAFLFKIFGTSITVERIYDIVVKASLSVFCYLVSQKISFSNRAAILSWGLSLLWISFKGIAVYPVYPAILFIFVGIYFFLYHIEKTDTHWIVCSGFFMTLGAMFRHDIAGMAALAILITLFIRKILDKKLSWNPIIFYMLAVLITGAPFLFYLIQIVGLRPLIDQLILAPAELIPKYRWVPYPTHINLSTIQFYVFPIVSVICLVVSLILIIKHKTDKKFAYGLFLLSLIGILFVNQVRIRSDSIHLFPVAMIGTVILPVTLSFVLSLSLQGRIKKAIRLTAFVVVVGFCLAYAKPVESIVRSFESNYLARPVLSSVSRGGYASMSRELSGLVAAIQDSTSKNEYIYVGVKNHDKFTIHDTIIYFLSERNYPTKYHELHPGVTNTAKIQREMIEEIKHFSVTTIILASRYWFEPNDTRFDLNINLLDDYILENFTLSEKIGGYEIWKRHSEKLFVGG